MQGSQQPQPMKPSGVASKYGDGQNVWAQQPAQIPINQGMQMGGFYPPTQAVLALVLGVLGFIGCSVCTAIPGLILANNALQVTNSMPGHPDSGTARAAQIISWIVIILAIITVVGYGLLFLVFESGIFDGSV